MCNQTEFYKERAYDYEAPVGQPYDAAAQREHDTMLPLPRPEFANSDAPPRTGMRGIEGAMPPPVDEIGPASSYNMKGYVVGQTRQIYEYPSLKKEEVDAYIPGVQVRKMRPLFNYPLGVTESQHNLIGELTKMGYYSQELKVAEKVIAQLYDETQGRFKWSDLRRDSVVYVHPYDMAQILEDRIRSSIFPLTTDVVREHNGVVLVMDGIKFWQTPLMPQRGNIYR